MTPPAVVRIVVLNAPDWPSRLDAALGSAEGPIVLAAPEAVAELAVPEGAISGLLHHPFPVTGVLGASLSGKTAGLFLGCDSLFWCRPGGLRVVPGGSGEVTLLTLRLGYAAASRVLLAGEMVSREEGVRAGWVSGETLDFDAAVDRAASLYRELSPSALTSLRKLLYHGSGLPPRLAEVLEGASFAVAFSNPEAAEGVSAFLKKRRARFGGTVISGVE